MKKRKKKSQYKIWKIALDKAWKVWSRYVRLLYANDNGMVTCYTCGEVKHYTEMQAGHYHHGKLDFDIRNIRPQCVKCNKWLSGNLGIYGEKLTLEYGIEGMKQLRRDAEVLGKKTLEELKEIYEKFESFK